MGNGGGETSLKLHYHLMEELRGMASGGIPGVWDQIFDLNAIDSGTVMVSHGEIYP